jgi:hypothetical protein
MTETYRNEFDPREHTAPVRPSVQVWRGETDPPDGFPFMRTDPQKARLIAPEEWQEGLPLCGTRNGV